MLACEHKDEFARRSSQRIPARLESMKSTSRRHALDCNKESTRNPSSCRDRTPPINVPAGEKYARLSSLAINSPTLQWCNFFSNVFIFSYGCRSESIKINLLSTSSYRENIFFAFTNTNTGLSKIQLCSFTLANFYVHCCRENGWNLPQLFDANVQTSCDSFQIIFQSAAENAPQLFTRTFCCDSWFSDKVKRGVSSSRRMGSENINRSGSGDWSLLPNSRNYRTAIMKWSGCH